MSVTIAQTTLVESFHQKANVALAFQLAELEERLPLQPALHQTSNLPTPEAPETRGLRQQKATELRQKTTSPQGGRRSVDDSPDRVGFDKSQQIAHSLGSSRTRNSRRANPFARISSRSQHRRGRVSAGGKTRALQTAADEFSLQAIKPMPAYLTVTIGYERTSAETAASNWSSGRGIGLGKLFAEDVGLSDSVETTKPS